MTTQADLGSLDPRGLIAEAYRMEGIGAVECRSIFFDWALSDAPEDSADAVAALLAHYGAQAPGHPMTAVLREGVVARPRPRARRSR